MSNSVQSVIQEIGNRIIFEKGVVRSDHYIIMMCIASLSLRPCKRRGMYLDEGGVITPQDWYKLYHMIAEYNDLIDQCVEQDGSMQLDKIGVGVEEFIKAAKVITNHGKKRRMRTYKKYVSKLRRVMIQLVKDKKYGVKENEDILRAIHVFYCLYKESFLNVRKHLSAKEYHLLPEELEMTSNTGRIIRAKDCYERIGLENNRELYGLKVSVTDRGGNSHPLTPYDKRSLQVAVAPYMIKLWMVKMKL